MLIPLVHGEPIRFGAEGQRGVVLDAQAGARIVDVADVGRGRAARARRDAHRPERRVPAVPAGPRSLRADADRRVPGRRAPRVRRRGGAPGRRGGRVQGRRRPRVAAAQRRDLGGRARRQRGSSPRLRKTRPVLGLGWKNVVFGGMRSPPWAVASIWATVTGRSSTPAWASPAGDRGAHVVDAVLEAELVRRGARRGRRRAGSSRGRARRPARRAGGGGAPRGRGARG